MCGDVDSTLALFADKLADDVAEVVAVTLLVERTFTLVCGGGINATAFGERACGVFAGSFGYSCSSHFLIRIASLSTVVFNFVFSFSRDSHRL